MSLLALLKQEAIKRNLLDIEANIDAATAFYLVRDMPYIRASSREPETIIRGVAGYLFWQALHAKSVVC